MELKDLNGLRIGTSEVTRLGMKESDMKEIAKLINRVVIKKEDPQKVSEDVKDFIKDFKTLHYSFNDGDKAYKYFEFH